MFLFGWVSLMKLIMCIRLLLGWCSIIVVFVIMFFSVDSVVFILVSLMW